ncbi:unnamed protein product [Caenorhabditis bovis]|uniref:CX domain-containing protein n=1 Tax=Caenorhabditis bovis TaxID=2654633 RepID=A0A8S1EUL2_9PELO|nr:unnamed protein product [Caenorhabditis bovis]
MPQLVLLVVWTLSEVIAENATEFVSNMSRLHCPNMENAVSSCPPDNTFIYYTCCGGAQMYCCDHVQTWFLTSLAGTAILLGIVFLACLVRYCCSYSTS